MIFPDWHKRRLTDDYEFKTKIGEGGFATVWNIERKKDKKMFACKMIMKRIKDKDAVESIRDEVSLMKDLCTPPHSHVVQFIEGFETNRRVFIVMEKCAGGDVLERMFELESLHEHDVKEIVVQLLDVLSYAHGKGIVHCDLKLENLLYVADDSNNIKLIDFGMSKARERFEWLTAVGGTAIYLAPECLSKKFNEAVDLWATGIMTFEMLHGYVPFEKESSMDTIKLAAKGFQNVTKSGPGPWWNKSVNISDAAREFILALLSTDPKKRPTAQEAKNHPWFSSTADPELYGGLLQSLRKHKNKTKIAKFAKHMCDVDEMHHWMVRDIKKIFYSHTNCGHYLSVDEFHNALNEICKTGDEISKEEVDDLFKEMNDSNTGKIDIDEFLRFYAFHYFTSQDDRIWHLVKELDLENTGYISWESVEQYMKTHKGTKNCVFEKGMDDDTVKEIKKILAKGPKKIEDFIEDLI